MQGRARLDPSSFLDRASGLPQPSARARSRADAVGRTIDRLSDTARTIKNPDLGPQCCDRVGAFVVPTNSHPPESTAAARCVHRAPPSIAVRSGHRRRTVLVAPITILCAATFASRSAQPPANQDVAAQPRCAYALDRLKRVALIVLALLTFLPSMVRAAASFECAMDGEVRLSCCCPKPKGARQDSGQHLEPACCCKITQMRASEPAPRGEPVVTFEAGPPVIVPRTIVLPIATPVHIVTLGPVRSPRGPPGPLFVRHCSLLI